MPPVRGGRRGFFTAYTGGIDTLDFSGSGTAVTIDLSLTEGQAIHADLTLTLSATDAVERVVGTAWNDTITGNAADNVIAGGAGDDSLTGGIGDDTYVFGPGGGDDTIVEEFGAADGEGEDTLDLTAVVADLTAVLTLDGVTITAGGDRIETTNVEALLGGTGTNSLDYGVRVSRAIRGRYRTV